MSSQPQLRLVCSRGLPRSKPLSPNSSTPQESPPHPPGTVPDVRALHSKIDQLAERQPHAVGWVELVVDNALKLWGAP